MAIQAVKAQIGGAALKPTRERRLTPIKNGVEWLEPMQLTLCRVAPKTFGVSLGMLSQLLVCLKTANAGLGCQIRRGVEHPLLLQDGLDRHVGLAHSSRSHNKHRCQGRNAGDSHLALVANRGQAKPGLN